MAEQRKIIAEDRRRAIAELARERGSVRVVELTEMFDVTETTIRRDLADLADEGLVKRSHGGAVGEGRGASRVRTEAVFSSRVLENDQEKQAIGARAAELVKDGSTIIVDAGTTATHLARALRTKTDLIVVTNAITTAVELMDQAEITLVLTGGQIHRETGGAIGDLAVLTLGELRVDQAFITINSVSVTGGLSEPRFDEVGVKRAMISAAAEVVLIADHSKFGRDSLVRLAPLTAVDHVVTSRGIDSATVRAIQELNVRVSVAEPLGGLRANDSTGIARADTMSYSNAEV